MFEDDVDFNFDDEFESSLLSTASNQPQFSLEHPLKENSNVLGAPTKPPSPNKKKRKFPGPAGFLPHQLGSTNLNDTLTQDLEIPLASQDETNSHFLESPWLEMKSDFNSDLLNSYNIEWIKCKLEQNSLANKKAPFLAAVITHIEWFQAKIQTITLNLKDPSGEIKAVIVPELYEDFSEEIVVGAVIVLRRFGVLTMGHGKSHCITITANNLLTVYRKGKKGVKKVKVVSGQEESRNKENGNIKRSKGLWDEMDEELLKLRARDKNVQGLQEENFEMENVKEKILQNLQGKRGLQKKVEGKALELRDPVRKSLKGNNIFETETFDFNNLDFEESNFSFQPSFSSTQPKENSFFSQEKQQNSNIDLPQYPGESTINGVNSFAQASEPKPAQNSQRNSSPSNIQNNSRAEKTVTNTNNFNIRDRLQNFRFLAKAPAEISPPKPAQVTVISCSQGSLENSQILQEAFEGIDTNSLFDDF